jgi:hypothetical protein
MGRSIVQNRVGLMIPPVAGAERPVDVDTNNQDPKSVISATISR